MKHETVTKIEAAERQLHVAIRLFFERRDMIAVHALAANSLDVLRNLARKREVKSPLIDRAGELFHPDVVKHFIDAGRKPQNFFKHAAGGDPDERLDFYSGDTDFILYDAAMLYSRLTGKHSIERVAFCAEAAMLGAGHKSVQMHQHYIHLAVCDIGEVFGTRAKVTSIEGKSQK